MADRPPQPVVLVGGRSTRFGRDKLRERFQGSLGGEWLVDQPLRALREVFGPPVWVVGDASPEIAARAERHLADCWPGQGPLGGLLTALGAADGSVFILAGDLPAITAREVRAVMARAEACPEADAVLARSDGPETCIGVYRPAAGPILLAAFESGERSLVRAVARLHVEWVSIPPDAARNANRPEDLHGPDRFRAKDGPPPARPGP